MKRQETLQSWSGRSERAPGSDQNTAATTHHHHAKATGCVAGIFQLVSSKYQNRRRFLTFGRKQERRRVVTSTKKPKEAIEPVAAPPSSRQLNIDANIKKEDRECCELRRLSCEVPRSPTIPPEIRRSVSLNSLENSTNTATLSPPALVARLMGLDEFPTPSTPAAPESAAEKRRRKLLSTLEKCDEDLKALRRIIEAVRSSELYQTPATPPHLSPLVGGRSPERIRQVCVEESGGNLRRFNFEVKNFLFLSGKMERGGGGGFQGGVKKSTVELSGEQPSPVSVLDEFNWSPLSSSPSSLKHNRNGRLPQQQQSRRKPGEDKNAKLRSFDSASIAATCSFHSEVDQAAAAAAWSIKSAMIDTVNEVCKDITWGQGREVVKIGLVIQDSICRDLIDEITSEMGCHNLYNSSFVPFQTCKRKLCF